MINIESYFKQFQRTEQLILDAEEAMRSAKHQHENAAKLLAIAVCPFATDEIVLLPFHRGKRWEYRGRVIGAYPARYSFYKGLYSLKVVVLKKDGNKSRLIAFVDWSEDLERMNGKPLSPNYNYLDK